MPACHGSCLDRRKDLPCHIGTARRVPRVPRGYNLKQHEAREGRAMCVWAGTKCAGVPRAVLGPKKRLAVSYWHGPMRASCAYRTQPKATQSTRGPCRHGTARPKSHIYLQAWWFSETHYLTPSTTINFTAYYYYMKKIGSFA